MSGGLTLFSRSSSTSPSTASGVPSRTIRPPDKSRMRVAAAASSSLAWVATMMVMPRSRLRRRNSAKTSRVPTGSSWDVGSSRTMRSGERASAAAMARRCFCPPDRRAGCFRSSPASPTARRASSTRTRISVVGTRRFSRAKATSPSTVVAVIWVSGSSKTMPTKAASLFVSVSSVSRPPIRTDPKKVPPKNCGTMPFSVMQRVDLPAPVAPIMPTNSPDDIVRSRPSSVLPSTPG